MFVPMIVRDTQTKHFDENLTLAGVSGDAVGDANQRAASGGIRGQSAGLNILMMRSWQTALSFI